MRSTRVHTHTHTHTDRHTSRLVVLIVPSQLFPVDLVPVQSLFVRLLLIVVHSNSRCLLLNVVQFKSLLIHNYYAIRT